MSILSEPLDRTSISPANWLPGYELLSVIGSGGFGTVYQARQFKLDRTVAVKVMRPGGSLHGALSARFEAEAMFLGKLQHPNVVQVYDCGHAEDRLYLAMELLEGEDLGQRLLRTRKLDERTAWGIARQAAAALAHAAKHSIVHRDIKPANLFLIPASEEAGLGKDIPLVKVMDFGLAKWVAEPEGEHLTASGMMLGTPVYMAPEQFRQPGQVDLRADIYALGATIFHALAGRPPFFGKTPWDVMAQKLEKKPRLGASISPESTALVADMMASDPAKRIGSYVELIERIDSLPALRSAASSLAARSQSRSWEYKHHRWMGAIAALGLVVGTGIGAWGGREFWPEEPGVRLDSPATMASRKFESIGDQLALFDGQTLNGWRPPNSGGIWTVESDDEKVKVLSGSGFIQARFEAIEEYRLTIGLDVHTAAAAEVHFAIPVAMNAGPRSVLRVSKKGGAVFGVRDDDKKPFQAKNPPVLFPEESWFVDGGRRPYLEVKIERGGGRWTVWFNGQEAGQAEDNSPRAPEVRLFAEGGKARVDSAILVALKGK
ncbi:MAG TPA: protein kinase [Urbifossiella sp.]|jgi:serine/threonine protein kinase